MHLKASYHVTEDEAVAASELAYGRLRKRGHLRWLSNAIYVLAALLLLLDLHDGEISPPTLAILLGGIPLVIFLPRFLMRRAGRRQYNQSASFREEQRLEWDGELLRLDSKYGSAKVPIGDFHAFAHSEDILLLFQTEGFYNLVPKRVLEDRGEALIGALQSAGVTKF